jgi:hypothetical protein
VAFLLEEGAQRGRDRVDEGDDVAKRDVGDRVHAVGLVLLRPVVTQADLVLIVEPGTVVVGRGGVEDPAAEAGSYPLEVLADRLAAVAVGEVMNQVRIRGDEAVPDVEHVLDLVSEDIVRQLQVADVVVAEQHRLLQLLELLVAQRRAGDGLGAVGVARDPCCAHHVSSLERELAAQSSRSSASPKGASTKAQWCGADELACA